MVASVNYDQEILKYGVFFISVVCVLVLVGLSTKDANASSKKLYPYLLCIFISLFVGFGVYSGTSSKNMLSSGLIVFGILFVIAFVLFISPFFTSGNFVLIDFIEIFLILCIGLFAFAIFYKMFYQYLQSLEGWTGLLANVIFYFPCLLLEAFTYIREEFKITPNVVFLLFIIEILLLLMYVYLPSAITKLVQNKGVLLQNTPVFLDHVTDISGTEMMKFEPPKNQNLELYRKNYGISFWLYLNEINRTSATEHTIFEYGFTDEQGIKQVKPMITYRKNDNYDNIVVYFSNSSEDKSNDNVSNAQYTIPIDKQKWNNIFINYRDNQADVFINGHLERTMVFDDLYSKTPIYSVHDKITVGSLDKSLYGAICNIVYYPNPLSKSEIVNQYNLYYQQNPPIRA